MDELTKARQNIDQIDQEMAKLFEQRMVNVKTIAKYKKEHSLPLVNSNREQEVIANNSKYISDEQIRKYYESFIKDTMELSKEYQAELLNEAKED